jgi:hypothetical protein
MKRWLVVAMVLAAACGGDGGGGAEETRRPRPSSTATINLVQPEAGATVPGPKMTIEIDLQGGEIVEETSTNLTPTEGHVHVRVNGKTVSQTYGLTQEIDIEPGQHLIEVEFVAKDHASFNPRVMDSVTVTVT